MEVWRCGYTPGSNSAYTWQYFSMYTWKCFSMYTWKCKSARTPSSTCWCWYLVVRVGQNPINTVYIRQFWLGNHQVYGHTRCIHPVLASPTSGTCTPVCTLRVIQQYVLPCAQRTHMNVNVILVCSQAGPSDVAERVGGCLHSSATSSSNCQSLLISAHQGLARSIHF